MAAGRYDGEKVDETPTSSACLSSTDALTVSVLGASFVPVVHTAPPRPIKSKIISQYTLENPPKERISSHAIQPARKQKKTGKKLTHLYKSHPTERMAEIEACAAHFMRVLIPNKVPVVYGVIDEDGNYKHTGVVSKLIPFIPYRQKPLEKYHLDPPNQQSFAQESEINEIRLRQRHLLEDVKKLKEFYEKKYVSAPEEMPPQAQTSSWGGWSLTLAGSLVSSTTQILGGVVNSAKTYANSYTAGTTAALTPQLISWLADTKDQLSMVGLQKLKAIITTRRAHLKSDHPGLDIEAPLLENIEKNLELKTIEIHRFSHSIIRHLEQIHTQIKQLGWTSNRITSDAAKDLFRRISKLVQKRSTGEPATEKELSSCGITKEKFADITESHIVGANELLHLLNEFSIQTKQGITTTLNKAIRVELMKNPQLIGQRKPPFKIRLNATTASYQFTPVDNIVTLMALITHLSREYSVSSEACEHIRVALAQNNPFISNLIFAETCPSIIQNSIETDLDNEIPAHFRVQDIDNYAIKKGLAEGLVASYLLKEGDLHANNLDLYGNRVDHDMTIWDVGFLYKLSPTNQHTFSFSPNELYDVTVRTPDATSFAISSRDILQFPNIEAPGYYYWPTKDAAIRSTVKFAFKTKSAENEFDSRDNELFKKLAADPVFIFHKFKTFLKFTLLHYSLYEHIALMHIRSDVKAGNMLLNQMKASMASRVVELQQVLAAMPEYQEFLERDGKYALELIRIELIDEKQALEDKKDQRDVHGQYQKNAEKQFCLSRQIQSIDSSLEQLEERYISLCPTFTPSSSGVYGSASKLSRSSSPGV
ncbi:MAG: hypothetical protein WAW86_03230 [Gammaproteobacteria bacterium]